MDMFIVRNMHIALRTDFRIGTRAMSFYVEKPEKPVLSVSMSAGVQYMPANGSA